MDHSFSGLTLSSGTANAWGLWQLEIVPCPGARLPSGPGALEAFLADAIVRDSSAGDNTASSQHQPVPGADRSLRLSDNHYPDEKAHRTTARQGRIKETPLVTNAKRLGNALFIT